MKIFRKKEVEMIAAVWAIVEILCKNYVPDKLPEEMVTPEARPLYRSLRKKVGV